MNFTHFTAGTDDDGRRLDKILQKFLADEHRSSLYKSLRKGLIKLDGKKCDGSARVHAGSDIQIADLLLKGNSAPQKTESQAKKLDESLIVLKNESILILNKPYDTAVQPSKNAHDGSLSELVQADYEARHKERTSLSFKTGPLHRLDRKTTGLIAFSQNLMGAQWFSASIKAHTTQKIYLALIEGHLAETQEWEDSISKNESDSAHSFHTVRVHASEDGKRALTTAKPLAYGTLRKKELTLAAFFIKTGRTHQIRSQSAYHGFPLLGDTAYGGTQFSEPGISQTLFLHAYELRFPRDNPLSLPERVRAPLSDDFQKILDKILINRDSLLII